MANVEQLQEIVHFLNDQGVNFRWLTGPDSQTHQVYKTPNDPKGIYARAYTLPIISLFPTIGFYLLNNDAPIGYSVIRGGERQVVPPFTRPLPKVPSTGTRAGDALLLREFLKNLALRDNTTALQITTPRTIRYLPFIPTVISLRREATAIEFEPYRGWSMHGKVRIVRR